jgi:hypothetical protein
MYIKPDLLGLDRVGVNEIAVNEEEAKTVQLIYMMYLAGTRPGMIAEELTMLAERRTHASCGTGIGRGRAVVCWDGAGRMRNERHCGDVRGKRPTPPTS